MECGLLLLCALCCVMYSVGLVFLLGFSQRFFSCWVFLFFSPWWVLGSTYLNLVVYMPPALEYGFNGLYIVCVVCVVLIAMTFCLACTATLYRILVSVCQVYCCMLVELHAMCIFRERLGFSAGCVLLMRSNDKGWSNQRMRLDNINSIVVYTYRRKHEELASSLVLLSLLYDKKLVGPFH